MRILRLATASALGCLAPSAALAQFNNGANSADVANLREDITGLDQRLAELSMRVEQLENRSARTEAAPASPANAVTQPQLAEAVAALSAQIGELRTAVGKLVTVPANPAPAPPASSEASASFAHEGSVYTVQKGDTLALISKKTGGRISDIVNANRLADPSHIVIGQKLFIPGGK